MFYTKTTSFTFSKLLNLHGLTELNLFECVWQGNNMGVIIHSFNLNISIKML